MSDSNSDSDKEPTRDMRNEPDLDGELVFNMETTSLDDIGNNDLSAEEIKDRVGEELEEDSD